MEKYYFFFSDDICFYFLSAVPPPIVTITGSPIGEGFHIGLLLTFTGRAVFNPAVDSPTALSVSSFWYSPITANTTNAMQVRTSPSIEYITTLSVYLQRADEDSGLYTVTFNISSGDFIIGVSATESRNIVVLCESHNRLSTLTIELPTFLYT